MTEDEKAYAKELEEQKKNAEAEEIRLREMAVRSAAELFAHRDSHIRFVMDTLGWPERVMSSDFPVPEKLKQREFSASLPFAMRRLGYKSIANPNTKDGRWRIGGTRFAVMYMKFAQPKLLAENSSTKV